MLAAAHAAADGYIGESGAGSIGSLRGRGAVATAAAHDDALTRRRARWQRAPKLIRQEITSRPKLIRQEIASRPKLIRLPIHEDGALASQAA